MQGLAHYADSPSPPGSSRPREKEHRSPSRPVRPPSPPSVSSSRRPSPKRRRSTSPISRDPIHDRDDDHRFADMSELEIFRTLTCPKDPEWGIPPEVDSSKADLRLRAKVSQYLRIKKQGQHINTSLLQSSSFANPHIYSKLVEFVDLDERATAFPNNGWLTARDLKSQIPTYGPKALSAQQAAMADAVRKEQGKRREISFTGAKTRDRRERDDREHRRDGERDRRSKERRSGYDRRR